MRDRGDPQVTGEPPPGWPADPRRVAARTPSGLFPSRPAPGPARPVYREPHPVRPAGVASGLAAGGVWLLGFGLLATDLRGYLWWTLLAGLVAWLVAAVLVRWGDRGVAAGVSMIIAGGWSVAGIALVVTWTATGDWPMW